MEKYKIMSIQEHPQLKHPAAEWFHAKWEIPKTSYIESMEECLKKQAAIPQWYVVLDGQKIIAGISVIENDFHNRKDLTPNVCAVYVEDDYRNQGIAGKCCSSYVKNLKLRLLTLCILLRITHLSMRDMDGHFYVWFKAMVNPLCQRKYGSFSAIGIRCSCFIGR